MKSERVSFSNLKDARASDFDLIAENDRITASELPDRVIHHLKEMRKDDGAYQIDRLQHVLQAATRCERDGADDDWICAALLHDIGDTLAPFTHGEVAAAILRPFLRDEVIWVVKHHGVFQMVYNTTLPADQRNSRDQFKGHKFYQSAVEFCEKWDQNSFDPGYPTEDIDHFVPLIRRVFARKPFAQA